jgi:hypothetical protein
LVKINLLRDRPRQKVPIDAVSVEELRERILRIGNSKTPWRLRFSK